MTPRELYMELRYQLAAITATTVGPCERGCGEIARGSKVCAYCLEADLAKQLPGYDWERLTDALNQSAALIVYAERHISDNERMPHREI